MPIILPLGRRESARYMRGPITHGALCNCFLESVANEFGKGLSEADRTLLERLTQLRTCAGRDRTTHV